MIDTFSAKTSGKELVVKNEGKGIVLIAERQFGKKPKLIDMAFGNFQSIVSDLRAQGYQVTTIL